MKIPVVSANPLTAILVTLALSGVGSLTPVMAGEADTAAPPPPAAEPAAAPAAEPAAAEPAAEQEAASPATEQAAAEPAAEQEAAAPAAEQAATESVTEETPAAEAPAYSRRSHDYRTEQNRRLAQLKEAAKVRRENMERWRSQRRWWNNPAAETRRQWNRARSQWYRDMAEARRKYVEQYRPDFNYNYRYWRVYP